MGTFTFRRDGRLRRFVESGRRPLKKDVPGVWRTTRCRRVRASVGESILGGHRERLFGGTKSTRSRIRLLRSDCRLWAALRGLDSPIVPVLLYNPTKIAAFSRECFDRALAVVVVGFPCNHIGEIAARLRVCGPRYKTDSPRRRRSTLIKIRYDVGFDSSRPRCLRSRFRFIRGFSMALPSGQRH